MISSKDYRFDLDFYRITDDTCLMIGGYSIEGGRSVDNVPKISFKNGKVIVENEYMILPGCSHYGNSVTVLSTTDGCVETLCELSGYRSPGTIALHVEDSNGTDATAMGPEDDNDHPDIEQAAMQCLQDAGLDPVSAHAGWSEELDLS